MLCAVCCILPEVGSRQNTVHRGGIPAVLGREHRGDLRGTLPLFPVGGSRVALTRIGNVSRWLKDELAGYEVNERFEDESYFERLNAPDSDWQK